MPGLEIHIFIVGLKNDGTGKIDDTSLKVKQISSSDIGFYSYVTGIDNSLSGNSFQALYFNPNYPSSGVGALFHVLMDLDSTTVTATLIY